MSNFYDLMIAHKEAQALLATAKVAESCLRDRLHKELFNSVATKGTHKETVEDLQVKCEIKYNYKFSDIAQLNEIVRACKESGISTDWVKFLPDFSKPKYDLLPDEVKAEIDKILVVTPATPSIEYKEV